MFLDYRLRDHEYRIHVKLSRRGVWTAEALGYTIVAEGTSETDAISNLEAVINVIDREMGDDIRVVYTG
jgi:hypothetical protein